MAQRIYSPPMSKKATSQNAQLGIYLEIVQGEDFYEIRENTKGAIAQFKSLDEAQKFCEVYRSRLMPTQKIKDVRILLNSKFAPPMPFNRSEAEMNPIKITDGNFVPVDEKQNVVVEHPDDLITF